MALKVIVHKQSHGFFKKVKIYYGAIMKTSRNERKNRSFFSTKIGSICSLSFLFSTCIERV